MTSTDPKTAPPPDPALLKRAAARILDSRPHCICSCPECQALEEEGAAVERAAAAALDNERLCRALAEPEPDGVLDAILVDVYVCTRSWEAWNYGTMGEGDFVLAAETEVRADLAAWRDAARERGFREGRDAAASLVEQRLRVAESATPIDEQAKMVFPAMRQVLRYVWESIRALAPQGDRESKP